MKTIFTIDMKNFNLERFNSEVKEQFNKHFPHQMKNWGLDYESGTELVSKFFDTEQEGKILNFHLTTLGQVIQEFYYNRYWNGKSDNYTAKEQREAVKQYLIEEELEVDDFDYFMRKVQCIVPQKMEVGVRIG